MNGIQEVVGSTPIGSIPFPRRLASGNDPPTIADLTIRNEGAANRLAPPVWVVDMPGRAKPSSFLKRQRERDRQQKQKEKAERRREAKARKAMNPRQEGDEDPDIAGIQPGPQPLPEQWNILDDNEDETDEEESKPE